MSDDGERARLEAIVFGRPGAATEDEVDAAAAELARRAEAERPRVAPIEFEAIAADPLAGPEPEPLRARPSRRRVAVTALAVILGLTILVGGAHFRAFTSTDSMAIFDRPQTESDLAIQSRLTDPAIRYESVRYAGSAGGYEVYVYRTIASDLSPSSMSLACMVVVVDEQSTGGSCTSPVEFALSGSSMRLESDGEWTDVAWDIRAGVSVTTGEHPPIPSPLTVFDEEQDDADLSALGFLPDIPPSQQDTVRFLNSSAGYFAAAYRGADDAVCLAVYEGATTLATSESACVSEAEFEEAGIQLSYPTAAPEISITWGIGPGVAFGGR